MGNFFILFAFTQPRERAQDGVKDAMERLGRIVLRATELALKDSSVRCPGMWHV